MKRQERLGQTWLVNDSKMKTKKPWIARRSTLEYWLAGTCFIFLALIVVLLVALSRDSAPLEPEWGNCAEWAGVVVTSFGFVGAIITVYMQGRSVRIQEEQHEESKNEKDAKAAAAERAAAKDAKENWEKWVRAVDFKAVAKHKPKLPGQTSPQDDGKLVLQCKATVRGGLYKDVRLIVPPPLDGFDIRAERLEAPVLGIGSRENSEWRVSGDGWFGGDDDKALEWLRAQGAAFEFTDPAGIRWRKDGPESFQELTPQAEQVSGV